MRNILIPKINSFNSSILKGLEKYIKHHNFLENQWKISFNDWFQDSVNIKKTDETTEVTIINNKFFNNNYEHISFWVTIWFESNLQKRPSNRSFDHVIKSLKKDKERNGKKHILNKKSQLITFKKEIIILCTNK